MRISQEQIKVAETVSSDVYDKKLSVNDGATLLAEKHGLNINSARDYINDYKQMMLGKVFQRAMSAPAIDYFLGRILEKRGGTSHTLAVSAVEQHINYYEQLRGGSLRSMRSVVEQHKKRVSPISLIEHESAFNEAVSESLSDDVPKRKERLLASPKIPTKVPVITYAYVRNPDVVAEVLLRAKGKCESCGADAPFVSKRTLQPYLEVHHIKQLSHGGEDTVANAMALCPNCHRRLHYGV